MANPPSVLNSAPPQPNIPFLDDDGKTISRPWFYYLMSLFFRTGGTTPIIPATLQQQINSLFVEVAMEDTAETGLSLARATLMDQALSDPPPIRTTDPILAALFASEVFDPPRVGEYISSTVLVGAAVAATNNVALNVTSISLTPGDWDVSGSVADNPAVTTVPASLFGAISLVSASLGTSPGAGAYNAFVVARPAGFAMTMPVGVTRMLLTATTTVYLVAQAGFSVSTNAVYGFIGARRMQ